MERLDSLSLYELNLLREASHAKSLRGLARRLGKRPAHLSKALKKLEAKLSAELFTRSASGIQLSADAVRLLPVVEEICNLGLRLRSDRAGNSSERQIAFSIAAVHFLQVRLCIPALRQLPKRYATKRLRFVEILPDELLQHAVAGAFDCAVHTTALDWPGSWITFPVGKIGFGLYARTDHALPTNASEEDVLEQSFVIPTYLSEGKFVPGADQCPVPVSFRKWSHEAASAVSAAELLPHSDSLAFLPDLAALPVMERKLIRKITVKAWPKVEKDLFLSVHGARVTKGFCEAMRLSLQRAME
jgi:DNA-binding transcriptional LysR family regulator